jgi:hypothetical protein
MIEQLKKELKQARRERRFPFRIAQLEARLEYWERKDLARQCKISAR